MKRSMLQTYVTNAAEAIALYQKAFDAQLLEIVRSPQGGVYHCELNVYGQILAVADGDETDGAAGVTGNIMQFCLHFNQGEEEKVKKAYEALGEGATVRFPLGPCDFSPCMTDIIDRFGVRWCIFVC